MELNQFNVHALHERLRKDKTKSGKEIWEYVKKLNESLEKQKELTGLAIKKIKQLTNKTQNNETRN